jgi:hypothetical protein
MRHYKYRALIKLDPAAARGHRVPTPGNTCRVTVRAHHHRTHSGKFFSALAAIPATSSPAGGDRSVQMTLTVLGDDVPDYLDAGDAVALWRGGDIGQGVITRRLPLWVEAP